MTQDQEIDLHRKMSALKDSVDEITLWILAQDYQPEIKRLQDKLQHAFKSDHPLTPAVMVGLTLQTSCCETHSDKDKSEFKVCPICLLAIHRRTYAERDKLMRILEAFPGFDADTSKSDPWIDQLRAAIHK